MYFKNYLKFTNLVLKQNWREILGFNENHQQMLLSERFISKFNIL